MSRFLRDRIDILMENLIPGFNQLSAHGKRTELCKIIESASKALNDLNNDQFHRTVILDRPDDSWRPNHDMD